MLLESRLAIFWCRFHITQISSFSTLICCWNILTHLSIVQIGPFSTLILVYWNVLTPIYILSKLALSTLIWYWNILTPFKYISSKLAHFQLWYGTDMFWQFTYCLNWPIFKLDTVLKLWRGSVSQKTRWSGHAKNYKKS